MPHLDEARLLEERGLRMLSYAKRCVENGDYDLAVFLAEQAAQLYLKSAILRLLGEAPRTHSLRQLLAMFARVTGETERVKKFVEENKWRLVALEDAYIASRYLLRRYSCEEAEELVSMAEEVMRLVRSLGGEDGDSPDA